MSEVIHGKIDLYVLAAKRLRLRGSVTRVVKKMRDVMRWIEPADIPAAGAR